MRRRMETVLYLLHVQTNRLPQSSLLNPNNAFQYLQLSDFVFVFVACFLPFLLEGEFPIYL